MNKDTTTKTMNTPKSLTIGSIPENLNEKEKADFFNLFWGAWSANGFGTLTKKDTELLIFTCLRKVLGDRGKRSNYEWSTLLRLTPSKIKAMRLESHLRFGHIVEESGQSDLVKFLNDFAKLQQVNLNGLVSSRDLNEVTVSFVVEDPVVQMEIEQMLKGIGSYLDFHRNREVVRISLVNFFKIIGKEKNQEEAVDRWVKDLSKAKSKQDDILSRVDAATYASMPEMAKLQLFIDDLAEFANVKPLTEHLKLVFKSQKEGK
jgi:hypothetical protein